MKYLSNLHLHIKPSHTHVEFENVYEKFEFSFKKS